MIVVGCDHGGYELKEEIKKHLISKGYEVADVGCDGENCDYPDIAHAATDKIVSGECEYGILCCGTGIGVSIAANKVKGIRAALVSEPVSAALTKQHNNSNMLCFGGRVTGPALAIGCVDAWLSAEFEGGRHQIRVDKIEKL